MYEEKSTTSEPGSGPPEAQPAPTYAPEPAPSAPPVAPGHGRANAALVAAVIALVIALIGVVMFPGPDGPEGPEGAQGTAGQDGGDGQDGDDGSQGLPGQQGLPGSNGADGSNGTACWDLNGNGTGDLPAEDINGDLVVDVNDCTGQDGADGVDGIDGIDGIDGVNGINCWDLNQNGIPDLASEDINGDLVVDVNDCAGPMGPPGPGGVMAWAASDVIVPYGACTQIDGLEVTITVPANGFVAIHTSLVLIIDHTSPTRDIVLFKISSTPLDCIEDMWSGVEVVVDQQPTSWYWPTTATDRVELVTAGTYTFYVSIWMTAGMSLGDAFWTGNTVAVFYPS